MRIASPTLWESAVARFFVIEIKYADNMTRKNTWSGRRNASMTIEEDESFSAHGLREQHREVS